MPNMDEVITNIIADITANEPTTGQEIIDSTGHKRHQIKHAINIKFEDNTITAPTIPHITNVIRKQQGNNDKFILGTDKILVTYMDIVSDQGNSIDITDVILEVKLADGNIRVKIYHEDNTLLGESGSMEVTLGTMIIPVNATIPTSGRFWVGLESDSVTMELRSNVETLGNSKSVVHDYGVGANPFNDTTTENPTGEVTNETNVPYIGVTTTENRIPRWYDANWSLV